MKKTPNYFWPLKPNVNFHKLLLTMKIMTILLFCGLALPAYSLTAEKPSGNDLSGSVAEQQQIRVTGTVTDASTGEVMPGVNIQVKGTGIGAISDGSGNYTLSTTDRNATLVFSFVGYADQEVSLAGRIVIDVALKPELTGLDEVVVVGYGTQKRANVVGSVTSITGASIMSIPSTSVSTAIAGRLPGSVVIQETGEPGNLGARILVRGRSTLGGNRAENVSNTRPLVIIDGIPGRSMDEIDPNDIASISVLKDASAAIYGAQAANGVILITTKDGHQLSFRKQLMLLNMQP
jgi:TonB-dependent SusC/RagA subfamily outer membrane receptor